MLVGVKLVTAAGSIVTQRPTYFGGVGKPRRIDHVGFSACLTEEGEHTAPGDTCVADDVALSLNEKVDHMMIWSSSVLPDSPAVVNARVKSSGPAARPDKHLLRDEGVRAAFEAQIANGLAMHGLDCLKSGDPDEVFSIVHGIMLQAQEDHLIAKPSGPRPRKPWTSMHTADLARHTPHAA